MENNIEVVVAFPTHIYTISKPEFVDPVRRAAIDASAGLKIEDRIHPMIMSRSIDLSGDCNKFANVVIQIVSDILRDQGYNTDNKGAFFESIWCQEHYIMSGMEQHTHPECDIVGFYFLDVPEDSSVLTFYDPRAGKVASGQKEAADGDITYVSSAFHLQPNPGLLVITNSWLAHSLTRNRSNNPIRFIHFNIALTDLPVHQCDMVEVV